MTPEETIKQLAADITKSVTDKMGELNTWRMKHDESIAAFGKTTDEQKNAIASISKEIEGLNARLTDLMQKSARPAGSAPAARSLGQQVIESDQFKAFQTGGFRGRTGNIPVVLGALTTDNGGGVLIEPQRLPGIKMPGQLPLRVRDLLAAGTTSSNAVEFVREKTFTNNAAAVAENTKKPESVIEFEQDSTTVKTLAHWIPASRQILDDASQLQSYIDARMLYGLAQVEDNQLMNGDGTGANLKGLTKYATAFDETLATSSTNKLDRIADAILQVWLTGFPANGIYMHPKDTNELRKLKDTIGRYLFSNPESATVPMPWGMRVVETTAVTEGTALVGSFALAAQVFDRQTATIDIADQDQDNFVKNMITIRAEERLALAVYYPSAIVSLPLVKSSGGSDSSTSDGKGD